MRFLAPAAAALITAVSVPSFAQGTPTDLHDRNVSPESSTGVNPLTTRGTNRGMPPMGSAMETRVIEQQPSSSSRVGTTTLTSAEVGAEERARPHRTLLLTGGAIFLGTYAASAIVGATVGTDADRNLAIPLAGPWIALGKRDCGIGECGFYEDVNGIALVTSGVAQAAGLALVITSLFVEETREHPRAKVRVVPIGAGLGAVGTF